MSVPISIASLLKEHVTLELESIDRMYLNVYVPKLQTVLGAVGFWRNHRGARFASSALMARLTEPFVGAIEKFARKRRVPLLTFPKGHRKDEIAKEHLACFEGEEGVLFIGKAQEKAWVLRTEQRRNPQTGALHPWLVKSTAMVNQYYFYCVDADFGPFFMKYSSYFPYNAKVCINGHEYLKRQLDKEGVSYEALDNGLLSCQDPKRAQALADGLSADKIEALVRKWQQVLPYPFAPEDTEAGYRYDVSILEAEFSLTQVFDRPLSGRLLFEELIRENLDIGRPEQVQLIFSRRVSKRTPGRFRTRVVTEGVIPSLHADYKRARLKQYLKLCRALRTELTINDTRDFDIGRRLKNLAALRQVAFQANRRLLAVQRVSHDCVVGDDAFQRAQRPCCVGRERTSALRFGEAMVQRVLQATVSFRLQPNGFSNRELREQLAPLLDADPKTFTQGRMTYQLRRLRLHGFLKRIPGTHRYQLTQQGLRMALFYTRLYARLLRPGLACVLADEAASAGSRRGSMAVLRDAVDRCCREACLAA